MEILTKDKQVSEVKTTESTNQSPVQEELQQPDRYYQAIGWLFGTVSKTEEGRLQITLFDGNSFGLTANKKVFWALAKQIESDPKTPLWIRCYPQYRLSEQVLYFKAVNFQTDRPENTQPGIFIFRGIWQFIPQCRRPVFSIYRNQTRFPEERIKNQHLPLIWKEQPPFRFRKESKERPQFFQIEARLISKRGCFGWIRNIAPPSKPPRKMRKEENPDQEMGNSQQSTVNNSSSSQLASKEDRAIDG